jgi:hypothetical protein
MEMSLAGSLLQKICSLRAIKGYGVNSKTYVCTVGNKKKVAKKKKSGAATTPSNAVEEQQQARKKRLAVSKTPQPPSVLPLLFKALSVYNTTAPTPTQPWSNEKKSTQLVVKSSP